jgi:selenocysteine lyase/cysteine desulfurase
MTLSSLVPRTDFPILTDWAYLNQAAIGLVPAPVRRAAAQFEKDVGSNGTIGFDDEAEKVAVEGPRAAAAALIGAATEDVAITTNATDALNQLAWGLRPARGSSVVSIDMEFPSVTYPWLRLSEQTGCEVRLLRASEQAESLTIDGLAGLVDDKTQVICVSHVQYATGHLLDPLALRALADSVGAVLIVDATQSAGVVPLDVSAGMDALVASGYKWLSAPCGAAFCYVTPALRERLRAPVGWRSTIDPPAFDATRIRYSQDARILECGTPSYSAALGLGAAIDYLTSLGRRQVHNHVLAASRALMQGLEQLGAELVTPTGDASRAGIVSARFPGHDAEAITRSLFGLKIVVGSRLGALRLATHVYNDGDDIDRALNAIESAVGTRPGAKA